MKRIPVKNLAIAMRVTMVVMVAILTVFIYYYSKGYRINIHSQEITKTGILNVKADPFWSDIYVDGENIGKSPKSKTLSIGTHNVEIKKDGYSTWAKEVEIFDERSTIITPWLLLKEPEKTTAWESKGIFQKLWVDTSSQTALVLIKDSNTTYSLWAYRTTVPFLSFSDNKVKLLTTESEITDVKLSPDGGRALITIKDSLGVQTSYIADTMSQLNTASAQQIDLTKYSGYTISWAENSDYIIFDSSIDIISYDISLKTSVILEKKSNGDKYIWTTDTNGYFYLVHHNENDNSNVNEYSIRQMKLDGTNVSETLSEIYFQKDTSYIDYYRTNDYTCIPCTNSPENTKTVGEITKILVSPKAMGIYIQTTEASYWYNTSTKRYFLVSPYPSEFVEYSHDYDKFIYKNEYGFFTFTLVKDELDPTEQLGSKSIKNADNAQNIHWINGSASVIYSENNSIYISDTDGANKTQVVSSNTFKGYLLGSVKEELFMLETDAEEMLSVNKYTIN
ncbi:MAG TPA: PEGA domain-containing protein [Candidatus Dojkabacteria bacterium]|nr:PEGA domain-containing protein [Candidatus Dojkabacteria bacterium]